jgi:hypothetical protein
MKDGDKCPKCGGFLYEGVSSGMVVCLDCFFEAPVDEEKEIGIYGKKGNQ